MPTDWPAVFERQTGRYRDGEARLPPPDDVDARQRQLTRMGNAAGGAALALLMLGRTGEAAEWFARAADRYRESYDGAPPGSWGRPVAMIKNRLLGGDEDGAASAARFALAEGAAGAESPIGLYAASLSHLVLGDWQQARIEADALRIRSDFPTAVADALATIAGEDPIGYVEAVEEVLASFEQRDEYLEDIPVADTVLVLQALAERRSMATELSSDLLPAGP